MKQLTQAVFDLPDCPPDALSAQVDSDGYAWWWDVTKHELGITDDEYGIGIFSSENFEAERTLIGDDFDASCWQNSAINRD